MTTKLMKELREYLPKDFKDWSDFAIGMDCDNNMTYYKGDIIYTRMMFRGIALARGWKSPFRFVRRKFKWVRYNDKSYWLSGQIVLIDSEGKELESSENCTWMDVYDSEDWVKWYGKWFLKNKGRKEFIRRYDANKHRFEYVSRIT